MILLSFILFIVGLGVTLLADRQRKHDVGEINYGYEEYKKEDPAWKFWSRVQLFGFGVILLAVVLFFVGVAT